MKKKSKTAGFVIALVVVSLLYLLFIELSKNTVFGWILTACVIAGAVLVRHYFLARDKWGRGKCALLWLAFLASLTLIYFISVPPVRRVRVAEGYRAVKTGKVTVSEGDITGVYSKDGKVEIYAGIPYAKPPVGELRWKEPQAPDKYDGVRVCDTYGPMAMQVVQSPLIETLYDLFGYRRFKISPFDNYRKEASEDCLYLNVFTPAERSGESLPVIFFIHGGSLTTGKSYHT